MSTDYAILLGQVSTRLESLSRGKRVFRVQHKTDKSYCIQFEEWEQIEAAEWWKANRKKEYYADFELALVEIESEQDRTMRAAKEALDKYSDLVAKLTILADRLGGEAGVEIRKLLGIGPNP